MLTRAVQPDERPLIAYAHEHDHMCPVCHRVILTCRATRPSTTAPILPEGAPAGVYRDLFPDGVPGEEYGEYTIDRFMRPGDQLHDARLRNAARTHHCPTDQQTTRYRAYLEQAARNGPPPSAPRIGP